MSTFSRLKSGTRITILVAMMFTFLGGCQSTRVRINDCKAGDWGVIGNKDGDQGFDPRYEERRKFCADIDEGKISAESINSYQAGWERGNFQYWQRLGAQDGAATKPVSYFVNQTASETIRKNNTPLNQLAYKQGWAVGNADYWRKLGDQDGVAGRPASLENTRASEGQQIGFNRLSYLEGWHIGNQAYWTHLGYLDAHEGRSDTEFKQHVFVAQREGVQLREDAYRAAWNSEIVEYWKKLAWEDATQGRDVNTRRADAKTRGLKFSEVEYKKMWEQRLVKYWQDAGKEDGFGKPNQFEQRILNVRRDNVFVISQSRDLYQQAWMEQNSRYCSVDNAFIYGRSNQRMEIELCAPVQKNKVRYAWESGQQYEVVLQKQRFHHDEMLRLAGRRNEAEYRLSKIERDIKHDQDNKSRTMNTDTATNDSKRDREKHDLREFLRRTQREFEDLRQWDYRYDQQLQQIKRDIYLH
ncbi:MAG: DUF2799 domain-containing protein [Undibacterium sp.]|nr:DUF2799 domain-containing protein [Undibacterium sp.]